MKAQNLLRVAGFQRIRRRRAIYSFWNNMYRTRHPFRGRNYKGILIRRFFRQVSVCVRGDTYDSKIFLLKAAKR